MRDYVKRLFLTGSLKYMILKDISTEKMTGYKILQNIRQRGFDIDAGSLYNSLKSLEKRSMVEKRTTHKRGAFEYVITSEGKEFMSEYNKLMKLM